MPTPGPSGIVAATLLLLLPACHGASEPDTASPAPAPPAVAAPPPAGEEARAPVPDETGATAPDGAPSTWAGDGYPGVGDAGAVDRRIAALLGDPAAYHDVFDRLQQGVAAGDRAAVAALMAYPLDVRLGDETVHVLDAQGFVDAWDRIVTPDIARAIAEQRFADLFVNAQGVMLGNGQAWINGVCRDAACATPDVRVVTLQSRTE